MWLANLMGQLSMVARFQECSYSTKHTAPEDIAGQMHVWIHDVLTSMIGQTQTHLVSLCDPFGFMKKIC